MLLKGIKFDSFHHFSSHSKVVHSEDHLSGESLFRSRFFKSGFTEFTESRISEPLMQTKIMQKFGSCCYK